MRRRNVFQFKKKDSNYLLQLTSMIDMFTLLLVFLLKSYSTSAVQFTPAKDLKLPVSTSTKMAEENLKLTVSNNGIYVDERKVADIENGQVTQINLEKNDTNFIRPLYDVLDSMWTAREQAKTEETQNKIGQVIMQADSNLPYATLKKVMYTASMAGYTNLKLATLAKE